MKKIKTYIPVDNSYQQCLDDNGTNHMLAGTEGEDKITPLNVIVQPFKMKVKSHFNDSYVCDFIIGVDPITNLRHLVIYYS